MKREITGLKDKNGEEIYEGDILRCNVTAPWDDEVVISIVGFIEFKNLCWWFNSGSIEYDGCYEFNGKVIGNILENPELVNKPKK